MPADIFDAEPKSFAVTLNTNSLLMEAARNDQDRVSRYYAVQVLAGLPGVEDKGAVLREVAADDESGWVRSTAIEALVETEGVGALEFLESRKDVEPSESLRKQIERSVAAFRDGE